MNNSRFELKVGLFVFIGAGLIALLILNFNKGITLFNHPYKLRVILPNAAGLKPTAQVMMVGVPIGNVTAMDLADDEKSVDVTVSILPKYKIRKDAKFHIDSMGFLGDQYVEVSAPEVTGLAQTNENDYYQNGDTVVAEPNFSMVEAVKSVTSVVDQAKKVVKDLDTAITNLNGTMLARSNLDRLADAERNLDVVSERAVSVATQADKLLSNNTPSIDLALTNFAALSASLTNTAYGLNQIVATNQGDLRKMVTNLTQASDKVNMIVADLQAGRGPVGSLLKDEQMKTQLASIVKQVDGITAELDTFTHNLNQKGIWAMLWKPKKQKHSETNHPASSLKFRH